MFIDFFFREREREGKGEREKETSVFKRNISRLPPVLGIEPAT